MDVWPVRVYEGQMTAMDERTKEAVRYLGYGRHAVDDKTRALVQEVFTELEQAAGPRIIYRIFELQTFGEERVEIGGLEIRSRSLSRNMKGCERAVMLGATLGVEADLLMKRYSVTQMSRSVVMQACAAAFLEEYLDNWQKGLAESQRQEGYYLRPRFSPGYGDFDIVHQGEILRMLDSAKKIGLTMTDSSMLTPTKSVTAVIGLSKEAVPCHKKGCETCDKTDCRYRR